MPIIYEVVGEEGEAYSIPVVLSRIYIPPRSFPEDCEFIRFRSSFLAISSFYTPSWYQSIHLNNTENLEDSTSFSLLFAASTSFFPASAVTSFLRTAEVKIKEDIYHVTHIFTFGPGKE
jgi:hypothetical protein